ncbi:MAG: type I-C CRISPR-associated protein Cas8c/Csd1 [Oscillospiraceae bacterium]|nr:type I-C CRISPR-associated protein Cas8c/Csd1 [Oscillospiraceae bacterium]
MILQALTRLFEDLAQQGKIGRPGWSSAKISYALCLSAQGQLESVVPLLTETLVGKKTQLRPTPMELPAPVTRTVGILPNFLWDNSSYLLGADEKGKPERSRACFRACAELHHRLLDDVDSPIAKAIISYFGTWQPEKAQEHPALADCWQELMKGANLIFRVNGSFAQDDPAIRSAWDDDYGSVQGEKQQCLVTGKLDVAEPVHPAVKGVAGAQSSGAALISFNAPAFCSYGKEQSLNAPVGKYAAFAYTAALNYLLADKQNVHRIGDTTIVCWAEGAEPQYSLFAGLSLFGDTLPEGLSDRDLHSALKNLAQGLPCEELKLDPQRPFYILGLAPNAARLSVRFFCRNSFGTLMKNVNDHHQRMEIVGKRFEVTPLWAMLRETVNQNTTDKSPSPAMAGATARAIFMGTAYPASLLEATMLRIRAEREITPGRAAILKAYYLRNSNDLCPKEVLTVSLNETSTNIPYTLGRLFAVYEALQESANPGINTTIKDKYFNSASATPATIFPILDNLSQKHLRKLDTGLRITYDRQIGALKNILGESNPARLSLPEQGSFNLGYYHQKQFRYTKKEEK